LKLGDSTRIVTFFADIESGDPYRQIVPPAIDAGPESGSFSFSPITSSASAFVTSLHASISPALLLALVPLPAGVAAAAGELVGEDAAFPAGLLLELQEVKVRTANKVIRQEQLLRRIKWISLGS